QTEGLVRSAMIVRSHGWRRNLAAFSTLAVLSLGMAARADDKKKKADPPAGGTHDQRLERARRWVDTLAGRPSPVDKLHASWNLEALTPESTDLLIETVKGGNLNPDAFVAACHALGELNSAKAVPVL